ncbi:uncharacterized protein LOC143152329 [Ptiloglossa arizonensis]|uniref:uncharacterized protein LOC143152329 n=1 Tax=Ptiloglossa arizonensis TaxID=3350558 RepID=UPI003FA0FC86
MRRSRVRKSRSRSKRTTSKKKLQRIGSTEEIKYKQDVKEKIPKKLLKKKIKAADGRKIFASSFDLCDVPLNWWEAEHVKYGLNYPPVKSQLQKVMESPIVRLTDRKYMTQLALNIIKDHEEQQKIRIEKRMLASPLIITELLKISHQVLSNVIQRQGINKLTLYA